MTLQEKGFLHLEGVFTAKECDDAAAVIKKRFNREGYHNGRIVNMHSDNKELLNISANSQVRDAIKDFLVNPVVYTSLSFEYGTQQNIHIDVPHFWTAPLYQFIGAWTALEDIHKDSGALEYIEDSHEVPLISGSDFAKDFDGFDGSKSSIEACLIEYEKYIAAEFKKYGCKKKTVLAKKGDVFIWHPLLAHGGGKVKDKTKSRLSYVTHWKSRDATITNASGFFTPKEVPPFKNAIYQHNGVDIYKQPASFEQKAYV